MRTIHDISYMVIEAEQLCRQWKEWAENPDCRKDKAAFGEAIRNYNALRGVIKGLRWSRGDPGIESPLE